MINVNAERLLADLRQLASFGKYATGVDRIAFSEPDLESRRWLCEKLGQIGLAARIDCVGNVYGAFPDVARALIIGSHSDTVPRGGWLDGALGVVYGLEIARALRESGAAPRIGVDVVSFSDEEGTFIPCLGSRSFCADGVEAEAATAQAKDGRKLGAVLRGLNLGEAPARCDPRRHVAYLEAHIEQGPRLEAARRRIGVVTGIVGIRRFRIVSGGQADHAGTTPMDMRKDAGAALFDLAAWVGAEFAKIGGAECVWNIGSILLEPGAANVVPSRGELALEFRDLRSDRLDSLENALLRYVSRVNDGRGATLAVTPTARVEPREMSPELGAAIASAARDYGEEPMFMPSGAGHDAMTLARLIPAAMLFVPSIGGRSHDISEDTAEADIVFGCQALAAAAERLAQTLA